MSRPEPTRPAASPATVFSALGDDTRLTIIARLNHGGARSISQLADGLSLTRQGVSRHLHVLEDAGIIASERVGRESRYSYRPAAIADARDYLARVSEQWDDAIKRLSAFVED